MSSMVEDAGGFVIISKVRPQNDQENGPEEAQPYSAPAGLPKPVVVFYRGEPEVLGFIISGKLSVQASVKPTVGKVKSSLVMNIVSSLAAFCGVSLSAIDLGPGFYHVPRFLIGPYCAHYKGDTQCLGDFSPLAICVGTLILFLMLFFLMFCINISTCVFACKTVCRSSFQEMTVVIYQTTSLNVSDTSRDAPLVSTAALTS
ncbi:hypothetical protein GDO81_025658 [Engystomops pustulosus]|uniref:Uncharacterized protein n=1 Tax=Engystomops pustulosus TaxID=76066 RepID=A0AAV6ZFX7_ENGPU|nr:hypothetical protein GDO81_025658 [Engystomops pustulosus]KAG8548364.1 hypothetical protein GDO81_025658 [Engystomops pustulosus]KAG8548365.1 hypothetical protein GDO81_025658 [Engystomops pustulosus]